MSGNGARPKSQPPLRHHNEEQAEGDRNLNNQSNQDSHLRDISLLLRDNERIKNQLSALQNQLDNNDKELNSYSNSTTQQLPGNQRQINQNDELRYNRRRSEQEETILPHTHNRADSTQIQSQQNNDRYTQPKNEQNHNAQPNELSRVVHEQMANQQPQLVGNSHQSNNQLENTLNVYQQGLPNRPTPPLDQDNENQIKNDQQPTLRGDQQLSRREIELLYTEMKKLQDEVEQHRSRFQENSQSTFGDCESATEDLETNDYFGQRRENNQLNRSLTNNGQRSTVLPTVRQRQTRSTSYLLGPDLIRVETECFNIDSEPDERATENNLALLTAQYEKNKDEDIFYVPPAMSLFNNWNQQSSSVNSIPNLLRSPPDTNQLTPGDQLTQTSDVLTQSASRCQQIIPNQLNTDYNAPSQSAGANVLFSNDTGGSSQANNSFEGRRLNRNKNELERQIKEQRDELARLIQKARCSPNMNEWHHQQAQTLNNNKENSHLQKTKNLKRGSVASVNIPPTTDSYTNNISGNMATTDETDNVSVVSEELTGTADNSFDTTAEQETSENRLEHGNQFERLRNIQDELDRLASQMERLTSSGELNNETSLLTRLGQMSFQNGTTNQNNLTTARVTTDTSVSRSTARLIDRTVNMISRNTTNESQIGSNTRMTASMAANSTPGEIYNSMLSSPSVSERIQSARNEANKSRVALPPIPASRKERIGAGTNNSRMNSGLASNSTSFINGDRNFASMPDARLNSSLLRDRHPSANLPGDRHSLPSTSCIPADLQMQQLTISVNQIYQVFWDLRRDLTRVIDRVSSLEVQMTAQDRLAALDNQLLAHDRVAAFNSQLMGDPMLHDSLGLAAASRALDNNLFRNSRGGLNLPGTDPYFTYDLFGTGERPRNFIDEIPNFHRLVGEGDLWPRYAPPPSNTEPHHHPSHNQTPTPLRSDPDSGVSSGALNNQVSPGMRANNYYDNFRSFSRQNRFDSTNGSPSTNYNSQQQAAKLREHQLEVNQLQHGGSNQLQHGVNLRQVSPGTPPANNSLSSYVKTRKKHKINREQNRNHQAKNSTNLSRDAQHYARSQNVRQNTESHSDVSTQGGRGDRHYANIGEVQAIVAPNQREANWGTASDLASNEASDVASIDIAHAHVRPNQHGNSTHDHGENVPFGTPVIRNTSAGRNINQSASLDQTRSKISQKSIEQSPTANRPRSVTEANIEVTNEDGAVSLPINDSINSGASNNTNIDNISKDIYTQIESLIANHERSPEFLASLLEDLTILSSTRNLHDTPNRETEASVIRPKQGSDTSNHKPNPPRRGIVVASKYNISDSSDSSTDNDEEQQSSIRRPPQHIRSQTGAATNVANISANIKKDWATQRTPRTQNSAVVSFSTPGSVSMIGAFSTPVQQHNATATTSNNLDSTPTQQIRENSCNVITPNPNNQPNKESNSTTTDQMTPRVNPILIRKEDSTPISYNSPQQSDTRTRSQVKKVAVVTAQTSQGSSLPEGTGHDQSSDEPVLSAVRPAVLQRGYHQNESAALSDSRQIIGQQDLTATASGSSEHSSVNNREILSEYSVPKNQQRRHVVKGEQKKVTPYRQDGANLNAAFRPELQAETIRQSFPVPALSPRQELPKNMQRMETTTNQVDSQGFLNVQLQEPVRQPISQRDQRLLLQNSSPRNCRQVNNPQDFKQTRNAGVVLQSDNVEIVRAMNVEDDVQGEELLHEMLSADDGLADLAEADQIHSEDQEPNNILHTDSGAESRREAQGSSIRQNVITTSNQVRNTAQLQHQINSRFPERGARNENVHNFSQLKSSGGLSHYLYLNQPNSSTSNEERTPILRQHVGTSYSNIQQEFCPVSGQSSCQSVQQLQMFPQQELTTPQLQARQHYQSSVNQQPIEVEQHLSTRQQHEPAAEVEQQQTLRHPQLVLRQHTPVIQQPFMRGEESNIVDNEEVYNNNEAVNNEQELLDTEEESERELVEEREVSLDAMIGLDQVPSRLTSAQQAMHVESLVRDEELLNQDALIQEVLDSPPPQLANSEDADLSHLP